MAVLSVALVHDEGVLVADGDGLPDIDVEDDDSDDWFVAALDRVGADVVLAPVVRLAEGHYLVVVGSRAVPPPAGRWVAPGALPPTVATAVEQAVREHRGEAPALRPAWFLPGWYDRVEAWVDDALATSGRRRTGRMQVVRVWSISAVLRIPTDAGEVWFKAACELFRGEAAVHRVVARHFPDDVPVLIASDVARAWLLMEPMAGADDRSRHDGAARTLADRWARLQLESVGLLDELRDAGCPVRDAGTTVAGFRRVVQRRSADGTLTETELAALDEVAPEAEAMVHELWACGLPDTLAHGDFHLGNVAYDGERLRVFDWTDGCISHPFLDGCHLAYFDDRQDPDPDLFAAFAEPWRGACPDARVDDAIRLAPVVDLLFQVDTFDRIHAATEPLSRHEMGGVVGWLLRRVPGAVAAAR